jgi:acyl-CoA synthetase (AMP-forming)/AMP-acid ligase II
MVSTSNTPRATDRSFAVVFIYVPPWFSSPTLPETSSRPGSCARQLYLLMASPDGVIYSHPNCLSSIALLFDAMMRAVVAVWLRPIVDTRPHFHNIYPEMDIN